MRKKDKNSHPHCIFSEKKGEIKGEKGKGKKKNRGED